MNCSDCGKVFLTYDPSKLKMHKKRIHEDKRFLCDTCPEKFATAGDLKKHKKSEKIRENKITARRTFELSPSNWRTPYAGISKESVAIQRINRTSSPGRRFSPGTPSRRKMEGEKLKSKKM